MSSTIMNVLLRAVGIAGAIYGCYALVERRIFGGIGFLALGLAMWFMPVPTARGRAIAACSLIVGAVLVGLHLWYGWPLRAYDVVQAVQ